MQLKSHHLIIGMVVVVIVAAYLLFIRKMPVPVKNAKLTSKYGNRTHPISGGTKFHNGIDLAAPTGTPIFAPAIGRVEKNNYTSAGGNQLFINHFFTGLRSGYAHLSKTHVKAGDIVIPGQRIADVGNTGQSTGPHLHLSVRKNGTVVDPEKYFKV